MMMDDKDIDDHLSGQKGIMSDQSKAWTSLPHSSNSQEEQIFFVEKIKEILIDGQWTGNKNNQEKKVPKVERTW